MAREGGGGRCDVWVGSDKVVVLEVWALWDSISHLEPAGLKMLSLEIGKGNCSSRLPFLLVLPLALPPDGGFSLLRWVSGAGLGLEVTQVKDGALCVRWRWCMPLLSDSWLCFGGRVRGEGAVADPLPPPQ